MTSSNPSTGYEDVATQFIAGRGSSRSGVGASVVAEWARTLPPAATILDLGCGTGLPISQILVDLGLKLFAVDASPSIVAAFHARFPDVPVQRTSVEHFDFFGRTFDAVVSWGLFFLLEAEVQRSLIKRVAAALRSGGKFLFTAPTQTGSSPDVMTGRPQFFLGYEQYCETLAAEGLSLVGTRRDEGKNHYYLLEKL